MSPERAPASSSAPRARPAAGSTSEELRALYLSCERFLCGPGRRDTSTYLASIALDTTIDTYGAGGVVEEVERDVAERLGKPAALFLISGTMAQQATLRIHADRRGRSSIVFHPTCHLDVHEERAYERLHGLHGVTCGPVTEPLTRAQLDTVADPPAALVIELPQRDLGGWLPSWDELVSQVDWVRERGGAAHLDGARLWEASPFYSRSAGKSIVEVAALFDTVYVSFYKGLGAIAGCCVAGEHEVIEELQLWRRRHGGTPYGLWPYAASAKSALDARADRFDAYFARAQQIGRSLRRVEGVEVLPYPVQSAMLHVRLRGPRSRIVNRMMSIAKRDRIWMFAGPHASDGPNLHRFEFNVGDATMQLSVTEIRQLFERVLA